MASLIRGSGGGILRGPGGALARGKSCCCKVDCCCALWGKDLKAIFQWGCPAEPNPAPLIINLAWNATDKCWRGSTSYCSNPAFFTLEAICSVPTPSAPPTFPLSDICPGGTVWLRIFTTVQTSAFYNFNCLPETVFGAFNSVLSESSCCSVSPGGLQSIRLEVA